MIDGGVVEAAIVAVHDQRERRARGFAEALGDGDVAVVADAAEVARRCDAVWVCTPTSAHRGAVDEALAAGRAVFCEKPLDVRPGPRHGSWSRRSPRGRRGQPERARAAQCAGLPGAARPGRRAGRWVRRWRRCSATTSTSPFRAPTPRSGGPTSSQAGGGCLIEHSIHDLDILRFCFGDVDSVVARTANHAGHQGIEDLAAVTLSFASGFEAQLTSVWHDIMSRGSTRRLEVFCRQGMVWLDDEFRGPLHVQTSEGTEVRACPSPPWVDALPLADDEVGLAVRAYVEADRAFVDAVTTGRPPEPGTRRRPGGPPPGRRRLPLCRRRWSADRSGLDSEDEFGASRAHPEVGGRPAEKPPMNRENVPASLRPGRLDGLVTMSRSGAGRRAARRSSTGRAPRQGDPERAHAAPSVHPAALAAKVPEVTVLFWVIKISTTAAGEAISDMFVTNKAARLRRRGRPCSVVALVLQFALPALLGHHLLVPRAGHRHGRHRRRRHDAPGLRACPTP